MVQTNILNLGERQVRIGDSISIRPHKGNEQCLGGEGRVTGWQFTTTPIAGGREVVIFMECIGRCARQSIGPYSALGRDGQKKVAETETVVFYS